MAIFIKEMNNASECIVELYKHAVIFKNTREMQDKHEVQPSSTSRVDRVVYGTIMESN